MVCSSGKILSLSNRLQLERDLHYALEKEEFILYYQPQVNVESGTITGAEALLRWNHPKWGLIFPGRFIPILEETSLIIPVGEWLIFEACSQHIRWLEKGLPPLTISINISPVQFNSDTFLKTIKRTLTLTGLNPSFLNVEMTEGLLMNQVGNTIDILHELKKIGIRVSIDDFGTGYSSLSYLKKFPVDILKIDRMFIKEVGRNIQDQAIVKAIIDMGKTLNLELIAEGTESAEQISYLKESGCCNVQGFFFSEPISPYDFEAQFPNWKTQATSLQTCVGEK